MKNLRNWAVENIPKIFVGLYSKLELSPDKRNKLVLR
jgi:hypothetical protein